LPPLQYLTASELVPPSSIISATHLLKSLDSFFTEQNPKAAAEIEMAIREKAGVISKKIEGNPLSEEKLEAQKKEEEVPTKKN